MNAFVAIRRLLAICLIASLAVAPLSRGAMAMDSAMSSHAEMMDHAAMADHSDAADEAGEAMATVQMAEMPCCPSKAPQPMDCDGCVLMAACMAKCVGGLTASVLHPLPITSSSLSPLQNDFWRDGLGQPPPDHPPRILV